MFKFFKSKDFYIDLFYNMFYKLTIVGLTCLLLSIFFLNFKFGFIPSESMYPAIKTKNMVLIKTNYNQIKRGDIVCFIKDNAINVKRAIGLPGENIKLQNNLLLINNNEIKEKYAYYYNDIVYNNKEIAIGENEYFFMGDNRVFSLDSRNYGCINKKDIKGVVIFTFKVSPGELF